MIIWTTRMDNILKRDYEEISIRLLAKELNVPEHELVQRAVQIGLPDLREQDNIFHKEWTDEELAYIKQHGLTMDTDLMAKNLGRTPEAVRVMAKRNRISLRKNSIWSKEEIDYLHQYYNKKPNSQIGSYLGRTQEAVRYKARTLGLTASGIRYRENGRKPKSAIRTEA